MADEAIDPDTNMIIREACLQMELLHGMLTRERLAELRKAADIIEGIDDSDESMRLAYDWFIRVAAIGFESAACIKGTLRARGLEEAS